MIAEQDARVRMARDRAHQAMGDAAASAHNNQGAVAMVRANEGVIHSNLAVGEEIALLCAEVARVADTLDAMRELLARIAGVSRDGGT